MRVVVSGASGLVGKALCESLIARGDEVLRLVRKEPGWGEVRWDPASAMLDAKEIAGADVIVNLAGESIGAKRWNEAHKARVISSRHQGTATLVRAVLELPEEQRPKVFINASAVGYYGDTGSMPIDESAPLGAGFLADVCRVWEGALEPLMRQQSIRVVRARFGVVLAKSGGALAAMLPAFRFGLGGALGDGAQGFSWVALHDAVAALLFAIDTPEISGPINVTAPTPVSNARLTELLGRALHRPTALTVPAFALRAALGGEMARELLLHGSFVLPRALEVAGFQFRYPDLESTLRACL